jgi:hypothetical protein
MVRSSNESFHILRCRFEHPGRIGSPARADIEKLENLHEHATDGLSSAVFQAANSQKLITIGESLEDLLYTIHLQCFHSLSDGSFP